MFPHLSQKNIDALCELYGDGSTVIDVVLNPPNLEQLIEKVKAQLQISVKEDEARLSLDECDEEDMLFSVLEFYKSPQFDPRKSLRVRFRGQPSVDVGGVRRQMFTNVFAEFIISKHVCLFQQGSFNLVIHYSVQNVLSGLMIILGKIISHTIVLEGIGFPHFSKAAYWYLATGDDNIVLEFASIEDVEPAIKEMLKQV